MRRLLDWVQESALSLGGPGLFLIAFLDSSLLSFPEVTDVLIVWLTTQHKHRMLYYASMSTIGSVAGCFVLYLIARKGGEAFLRKRFQAGHVDHAMKIFRRYGLLAIAIPSILPPPVPFKIFVFAAGVSRVPPMDFLIAVTLGRSVRYFGEGVLALWYGEQAAVFLRENATIVLVVTGLLIVIAAGLWTWWSRRAAGRRKRPRSVDA
jgi:membrane protein YqaA with SNARE-associated domain